MKKQALLLLMFSGVMCSAHAASTQQIISKIQTQIQSVQASIPKLIKKQAKATNAQIQALQGNVDTALKDVQRQVSMVQANMQQNLEKQAKDSRKDLVKTRQELQAGMKQMSAQIQELSKRSS